MSGTPHMRLATYSDVEELRQMLIEDDSNDYIPDILDRWVEENSTYVAVDDDEILGMAHKQLVPDGSLYLGGLRVRRTARRTGVGKMIADFMIRQPESNTYRLIVDEENEASIALSLKTGYKERLSATIWMSKTGVQDMAMSELDEESVQPGPGSYFGGPGSLIPTAWYAFELNGRAERVMGDFGLSFMMDGGKNIYIVNSERSSVTPIVIRKREMLSEIPEGFVLFGRSDEDFDDLGFDQSLWARRLIFFEYVRDASH